MVASKAMPPCQLFSDFGSFSSVPGLSSAELVKLRQWSAGGALSGVTNTVYEAPKPKARVWRLGQPAVILKSGPISAPSEGGIHWVFAKVKLKQGGRIRGMELRPRDPRAIRQATIGWASPGISAAKGRTALLPSVTPIGSWAFGYYTWRIPHGSGISVPDGAELHVMLQCQATGKRGDASFSLALYFDLLRQDPAEWIVLERTGFTIDVGEKPEFVLEHTLEADSYVTALLPEFRYACERVDFLALLPNGQQKALMAGRWDVYWTGAYTFIAPPLLPKGTSLRLEATYNNGFDASHGPDLRVPIEWGYGLQNELCRMSVQLVRR